VSRYPSPEPTTNKTKWIAQTALFLALTLVLPIGFHAFGVAGRVFLPMHIPVLLAGFLVGPASGLVVGLMSPGVLHLLSGMPPAYAVPLMSLELPLYGLVAGLTYKRLRMNIYVSLVIAMVIGRLMFGLGLLVLGRFMDLPYTATFFFSATGPMIAGLPGVVLQIFLIPLIVAAVRRNRS
jgi:riboflavin transporter FmnP